MTACAAIRLIHRADVSITLRSPWLTRGNLVGLFGIDTPLARTQDGTGYILPGTLVAGRLAEAFRHFADCGAAGYASDLVKIFGHKKKAEDAGSDWDDLQTALGGRRRLFIGDLVLDAIAEELREPTGFETHVAIDPLEGRATDGALLVIEKPCKSRAEVTFTGELRLIGTDDEAAKLLPRLRKALVWLTQVGGDRSTGSGEMVQPELTAWIEAAAPQDVISSTLRLRLSFSDLLCVGDLRTSPNEYRSSDVVPGGAIKGAIAHQIAAGTGNRGALSDLALNHPYRTLGQLISGLRISHAFPVPKLHGARPMALPKSWALAGKYLFDHAQLHDPAAPCLVADEAPRYPIDWKGNDGAEAMQLTNWPNVPTELRIRTQIDEEHRAALANRLFAISYRRTDQHDWVCDVDFDGSEEDRAIVFGQLAMALKDGLGAVGRGGAYASVTVEMPEDRPQPDVGTLILTLQTPALLRRPDAQDFDLTTAYAAAFASLGIGAELTAIFVDERLRGAAYMAKRMPDDTDYRPWLLTESGSVFVFEGVSDSDIEIMKVWLGKGLAIPDETLKFYGLADNAELWRHCPWLPENGYGEVRYGPTMKQPADLAVETIAGVLE